MPKSVLIIDDSPDNILLLSTILKPIYQVKAATSAEIALRILTKGTVPDLILLDIVMPGMDGFELCEQLQANATLQQVPVWLVSGNDSQEYQARAQAVGAKGILAKPLNAERLLLEAEKAIYG